MAVDKQIMNRRQGIVINAIDPEILTEAKLSADGFVKNTDYAGADTAGVVKVTASNGLYISSSGALGAASRTAAQYESGGNTMVIGKATLENIISGLVRKVLLEMCAGYEAADAGTLWSNLCVEKHEDDAVFSFVDVTP